MQYKNVARFLRNYRINTIVKVLIISDFFIFSAHQLFAPIFAIFVTDRIAGGVKEVGIATAIFFVFKAIFEIPVGMHIDKTKSEKDDLYSAVIGTLITAFVFLWYMGISTVWELYLIQAVLGIGAAVAFPGWYSIFTRHIDKNEEAFEWSFYDVLLGIGMASSAALGGLIAGVYGFNALFLTSFAITTGGAILLISIRNKIYNGL